MPEKPTAMPPWLGQTGFIVFFSCLVMLGVANLVWSLDDGTGPALSAAARLFIFVGLLLLVVGVRRNSKRLRD